MRLFSIRKKEAPTEEPKKNSVIEHELSEADLEAVVGGVSNEELFLKEITKFRNVFIETSRKNNTPDLV